MPVVQWNGQNGPVTVENGDSVDATVQPDRVQGRAHVTQIPDLRMEDKVDYTYIYMYRVLTKGAEKKVVLYHSTFLAFSFDVV